MAFNAFDNFVEIQKLKEELRAKSGNLVSYDKSMTAVVDGQTEFTIDLSTFNAQTDTIHVYSGKLRLSPVLDFVVTGNKIVLNEGVPIGRTVDITVMKNVENLDEEKTIDGMQIGVGSVPLDKLEEDVATKSFVEEQIANIPAPEVTVTSDIPIHLSITENNGLRITYDDGK